MACFHDAEKRACSRGAGQNTIERQFEGAGRGFGAFEGVEDKAAVKRGGFVFGQGRASLVFTCPGTGALAKITRATDEAVYGPRVEGS